MGEFGIKIKQKEKKLDFLFKIGYKEAAFEGQVAEWLKAHAWKVCLGLKPNASSNLALSAS